MKIVLITDNHMFLPVVDGVIDYYINNFLGNF